jgi:hypothetical protein
VPEAGQETAISVVMQMKEEKFKDLYPFADSDDDLAETNKRMKKSFQNSLQMFQKNMKRVREPMTPVPGGGMM